MTAQSDVHTALMARAEVMASGLSIDALWPRKGGEVPAGEYLIVTLVSLLNVYEAVSQERAGLIAAYFPRALRLNANSTTTTITSHTVKPGRQVGERWETPIWISYWSMS